MIPALDEGPEGERCGIGSVSSKKEWKGQFGLPVSAAGLVLTAVVMVFRALERWGASANAPVEPSTFLPITMSIVPLGLSVFGFQKALRQWRTDTTTARVTAGAFAALFALGLVIAQTLFAGE